MKSVEELQKETEPLIQLETLRIRNRRLRDRDNVLRYTIMGIVAAIIGGIIMSWFRGL